MATADIEEYLPERDWGHTLFSKQYFGQLLIKVVRINNVVQKFIDSETISEAERKSLLDKKVTDQKLRNLLTIITEHCNRNDLQPFKTFIDILEDTNNVDIAQRLSLIYNERVDYVAILRRLLEEKALVRDMENDISHLQRNLEVKEKSWKSLTDESNKIVDQDETFRKEQLSLDKPIKIKDEDLLVVGKEMGELTRIKNALENEVEIKSNVIRKRDKEIVEKEREVQDAIEESNRLRLKIDTLQQQHNKAMVKDKEMSKKIEKLEDEITEKENTIMDLRKNKSIIRKEIEEEFRNIIKSHEKNLNDQKSMIKRQNEKIDAQAKAQMASAEKHTEALDDLRKAQIASDEQHNENFGMIMRALKIQKKK